ncbi:MAG: protein phosphatase 2C domain-containing protein [Bacteroidaceae bacterium]|nr:protein phosphatase 2C domain-containing protein [Bacteroidaceae bacterium]MDO4955512.1 protein phosphatase 2C domain-containing protein [Bacteroidales bacterium]
MFVLSISANCNIGKQRQNNEDMLLIGNQQLRDDSLQTKANLTEQDRYILAVADGLGGHESGEVASEMVTKSLSEHFLSIPKGLSNQSLQFDLCQWLQCIHEEVNTDSLDNNVVVSPKGTTLVSLVFYENNVFWLNCGDSRLYRFRGGVLTQISKDHSLSNVTGDLNESNVIVNCIGAGSNQCYMDFTDMTDRVISGDTYLLCSDGLTDMCSDEEIERVLLENGNANRLVDMARANGGVDNISVIVVSVEKE